MARVPYLDQADLAPAYRDLLDRPINLFRALVHSPDGARAWSPMGRYVRFGSKLDPRLREMAIIQIGYVTRSAYEYSHHLKIGRDFGVSDDDIRAIAQETAGRTSTLEPLARTVLRAAREITTDIAVSDQTFTALQESLDNERLTDLVLTMALYNGVVRILATMQIDVEDEYQTYLDQFPLPS